MCVAFPQWALASSRVGASKLGMEKSVTLPPPQVRAPSRICFLFSKPCLDFCLYEVCPIVAFLESTMSSRSGCVCSWRVVPGKKSPLFTKTPRSKWYLFLNLSASWLIPVVFDLLGTFLLELQQRFDSDVTCSSTNSPPECTRACSFLQQFPLSRFLVVLSF